MLIIIMLRAIASCLLVDCLTPNCFIGYSIVL